MSVQTFGWLLVAAGVVWLLVRWWRAYDPVDGVPYTWLQEGALPPVVDRTDQAAE